MSRRHRDPELPSRERTISDLREAADLAARQHGQFAALWAAIADAAEQTPVAARWGIPEPRVQRDGEEELRWAAVVTRAHALAVAYVRDYAASIDLDAVIARSAR